jgi:hypothetical protein
MVFVLEAHLFEFFARFAKFQNLIFRERGKFHVDFVSALLKSCSPQCLFTI